MSLSIRSVQSKPRIKRKWRDGDYDIYLVNYRGVEATIGLGGVAEAVGVSKSIQWAYAVSKIIARSY